MYKHTKIEPHNSSKEEFRKTLSKLCKRVNTFKIIYINPKLVRNIYHRLQRDLDHSIKMMAKGR